VPLAGYGSPARRLLVPDFLGRHPHAFWLKPSTGALDAIMARALVLQAGSTRLLWVAVDLVAVDAGLADEVRAAAGDAGLAYDAVILSASHTHSGPGAFVDSKIFGVVTADRFDPSVRRALVAGIADAARRAERAKTRAVVAASVGPVPGLTESRLDLPLDPELAVLRLARPDGAPIALVWNYAIHGTALGPRNRKLSGDLMGVASHRLERRLGVPVLFVNGAVGDVSPRQHGESGVDDLGGRLADAVAAAWQRARPRAAGPLEIARSRVDLPAPFLAVRNCTGGWAPGFLTIPLDSALPRAAELIGVRLGDIAWVTIPGELQTALGRTVKEAGRRRFEVAFVAGLSNGYLGYLLTAGAYRRPGYIGCASLFGDRAGERVADVAARLLERLGAGRATSTNRAGRSKRSRCKAARERRLRRTSGTPQGGATEPTTQMGLLPRPGRPLKKVRWAFFSGRPRRGGGRGRTSSGPRCCGGSRPW
jgi:hypothetical protein